MGSKNPRQIIIDGLDKSETLYLKLQSIVEQDSDIDEKIKNNLENLEELKKLIRTMPLKKLKILLQNSL